MLVHLVVWCYQDCFRLMRICSCWPLVPWKLDWITYSLLRNLRLHDIVSFLSWKPVIGSWLHVAIQWHCSALDPECICHAKPCNFEQSQGLFFKEYADRIARAPQDWGMLLNMLILMAQPHVMPTCFWTFIGLIGRQVHDPMVWK